ncbi:MAG TPA: hypothetical protein VFC63_19720 [Blastocatellia bacterium]|nr:hypothetical protein [Blastocatellia bacterium]
MPKLIIYFLLASMVLTGCSGQPRKASAASSKSKDILHKLIPDEFAEVSKLNGIDHKEAVSALLDAQEAAIGMKKISIAYLLAVLGQDYEDNRNAVATAISGCGTESNSDNCEVITSYGTDLFNRGDKTLLKPLLEAGIGSDGTLAETLGDFYSNVLWKDPQTFLQSLSEFPKEQQAELSMLAGAADGSGMGDDMSRDVRQNLSQIAGQKNNDLALVAKTCLDGVNKGDKLAKSNATTDK